MMQQLHFWGYIPKVIESKDSKRCTPMFTEALLTIGKGWKKPKSQWTDE